MTIYEITLKPLGAYFFGGERTQQYGTERTQMQKTNPYFVKSEPYLRQTTAFGALRFLGIHNPRADFSVDDDTKNRIGEHSFQIEGNTGEQTNYGQISSISPVFLRSDITENLLLPAPTILRKLSVQDGTSCGFRSFFRFVKVTSPQRGERWLPLDYDEKNFVEKYIALTDGKLEDSPFYAAKSVRVGINIDYQDTRRKNSGNKGFFKKEYYELRDHSFVFYACINDDRSAPYFGRSRKSSLITLGQGKSPFAASWRSVEKDALPKIPHMLKNLTGVLFPIPHVFDKVPYSGSAIEHLGSAHSSHTGDCVEKEEAWWGYALSDVFLPDNVTTTELQKLCCFMAGEKSSFRQFTTINSEGQYTRFKRYGTHYNLLSAGTTILFRDANQCQKFKEKISYKQAQRGGFNNIFYTKAKQTPTLPAQSVDLLSDIEPISSL